jgi:hypothetical protein
MNDMTPFIGGTTPNFDSLIIDNFISGTNGGPLHLLSDPAAALDAVTKQYSDTSVARATPTVSSTLPPGPSPGQLWFNSTDGQLYVWYNDPNSSQWVIANNTGIQDAPIGTVTYGRQNRTWVPALALSGGIMTGPLVLHNDPTTYFMAATKGYVDVSLGGYLPLTGGTISGQLTLSLEPVVAHQAANKGYVDLHAGTVVIGDTPPANPIPGQMWFDSTGVQLYIWYVDGSGVWAQVGAPAFTSGTSGGGASGAFPEAPVDGRIYGRNGQLQSWAPVLPILGGTMAGPIILVNSSPVLDDEAASKRYVEDVVATAMLWQGNYNVALNQPDLTTVTPILNGYSWTTVTQDPAVPEVLTITLPGLPPGTTVFNGDLLRYTAPAGIWFVARGSGITKTEADATFVFRAGDTMTGELYLAADPVDPLEAATMRFVEAQRVTVSSLPPATPFEGQLWFDLQNPNMYIWVIDATSAQWVAAAAPPVFGGGVPFVDFIFPANPTNGQITTAPNGQSWVWNATDQRWEAIHPYVLRVGDSMSGPLTINNSSFTPALNINANSIAHGMLISTFGGGTGLAVNGNSSTPAANIINSGGGHALHVNNASIAGTAVDVVSTGSRGINISYNGTGVALDITDTVNSGSCLRLTTLDPLDYALDVVQGSVYIHGGGLVYIGHDQVGYGWREQHVVLEHAGPNGAMTPVSGAVGIGFHNFNVSTNGGERTGVISLAPQDNEFVFRNGLPGDAPIGIHCSYAVVEDAPTLTKHAANKAYVDSAVSVTLTGFVQRSGDYMNGPLNINNTDDQAVALVVGNNATGRAPVEINNRGAWPAIVVQNTGGGSGMQVAGGDINFSVDNSGIGFFGGSWLRKAAGTNMVIRTNGFQIEDINGGNRREILDAGGGQQLKSGNLGVNGARVIIQSTNDTVNNYTNGILQFNRASGSPMGGIQPWWTGYQGYGGAESAVYLMNANGGYGYNWWIRSQPGPSTYVNGTINAYNFNNLSDISMKRDVGEINEDLINTAFAAFKPVKFRLKPPTQPNPHGPGEVVLPSPDPDRVYYGLVADDVERGMPDAVSLADYTRRFDFDGNEIKDPKPNILKAYDMAAVLAIAIAKIKQLEARLDGIH